VPQVFILYYIGPLPVILAGICLPSFKSVRRSQNISTTLLVNLILMAEATATGATEGKPIPKSRRSSRISFLGSSDTNQPDNAKPRCSHQMKTFFAEIATATLAFLIFGGIIVQTLVIVGQTNALCGQQIVPYENLWMNGFPKVVIEKHQRNRNTSNEGSGGTLLPLNLGFTTCRYDLVTTSTASNGTFTDLPSFLSDWVGLTSLDVRWNKIQQIPLTMLSMKTLKTLLLQGNPVETMLNLSHQQLPNGSLPFRLTHVESWELDALVRLDLTNTSLTNLPVDLHASLPCLREIYLGGSTNSILSPITPQLFLTWKNYNNTQPVQRCAGSNTVLSPSFQFQSVPQQHVAVAEVDFSFSTVPLTSAIWSFLSSKAFHVGLLNLRCSGLSNIDFTWFNNPQNIAHLHAIDFSDNNLDTQLFGSAMVPVEGIYGTLQDIEINAIWLLLRDLLQVNLSRFLMENGKCEVYGGRGGVVVWWLV
jgi:Leucine-rich repeat (LRR) protein